MAFFHGALRTRRTSSDRQRRLILHLRPVAFALLAIGSLVYAERAAAQQSVWFGSTGSWYTLSNWQSNLVPNAGRSAVINNGGTAQVNLSSSAQASSLTLGSALGQSGHVQVSGADSLTTGGGVEVARGGTGSLTVSGGADVISGSGTVGVLASSNGAANIMGVGSLWTTTGGPLVVADAGFGSLNVTAGGIALGYEDVIGNAALSNGIASIDGAGSSWLTYGTRTIGRSGTGILVVTNGATTTSDGGVIGDQPGSNGTVGILGSGSRWNVAIIPVGTLQVGNLGRGDLTVADGGVVRVGLGFGQVTINQSSTFNIGAGGLAGFLQADAVVNNGQWNFYHTDSVVVFADVSGNGRIDKTGSGDTTLVKSADFTGVVSAHEGLLILRDDGNAAGYLADGSGTLQFFGVEVNLGSRAIRANAGGTVEYNTSNVDGGFLRGVGMHTIVDSVGSSVFTGVTTFNSTTIVQNGYATLNNFTNGGTIANNAPLIFDGVVNTGSGVINVTNTLTTTDFGNNGVLAVAGGGAVTNLVGNLVSAGGSRTTIAAGGTITLEGGTTLELNGALLVNNGEVAGTTNVNFGSLAKGEGVFGVVNVADGGTFSPGNSPGVATLAAAGFHAGGAYLFELSDAAGIPGAGMDFLAIDGALDVTAGSTPNSQFTIEIVSLDGANQPGLTANFDPSLAYEFVLASAGGGITGFAAEKFKLDASAFENDADGGQFSLVATGNDLVLNFTPDFLAADFEEDHDVDGDDLERWKTGFNGVGPATHMQGDADGDQDVDGDDFLTWQRQLNAGANAQVSTATVPEPAGAALLLMALAGLVRGQSAPSRSAMIR